MDLSRSGNEYALVVQEFLTKWPEVYSVKDRLAQTVVGCLIDFMCSKSYNPWQGSWVYEWSVACRRLHARVFDLTQLPNSGSHPQTDSLVEGTLKQMLSQIVIRGGKDWDELLGPVLFAYKTAPHSYTGETLFHCCIWSRSWGLPARSLPLEESHYAKEFFKELKQARQLA